MRANLHAALGQSSQLVPSPVSRGAPGVRSPRRRAAARRVGVRQWRIRHRRRSKQNAQPLQRGQHALHVLVAVVEGDVHEPASCADTVRGRYRAVATEEEHPQLAFQRERPDGERMIPAIGDSVVAEDHRSNLVTMPWGPARTSLSEFEIATPGATCDLRRAGSCT